MATRYENIIKKLDKKRPQDLKICERKSCACNGCCGYVSEKKITQKELDMYLSGELREILNK
ncbi:hypothetical protein VPAG_00052 [Vibrio phage douglas 12A4]|uniref:hypothetical protein n=1 Tax=Vibrio phage douglas 12A4 TaxID=573171 RepID=UPI0002C12412|nr:hypothetical protein VPAG_00052 [Vibrio phage douglas 12A4]AGG58088.1 hypothetical protein VPAG_00052 [Vibrio phage douglas 12A4]